MKNWKIILALAIPSVISYAAVTLAGTINLIMIGRLGALTVAAVGVSNIIMYNAWAIFSGIGNTINYLVAQNFGENNMKKGVERTYIALYLCLIVALLVVAAGLFAPGSILRFMGGSEELVHTGEPYLQLRFFAMVFTVASFVFYGFLRGIGDTRTPMILTIIGNLVMVFLTYSLTYGHFGFVRMGLPGAGLAMLIGELISFLGCLYFYFVQLHSRFRTRSKVSFDRREAKLILAESGKLGMQEFAMSVSMFIFTMFVTRLGTDALAANEVSLNVMSLGFMPAFAFGATATILVGQQIGKSDPQLARRIGTETAIIGAMFLFVLGLVEFIFAEQIARIYISDPAVYHLAARLIMISAFLQLFDGMLNFYAGGLRGIGATTFLLRASFVLSWLYFVPMTYLLVNVLSFGSVGAWLSLYSFLAIYAIVVTIRFYRTDWMSIRLKSA